MSIYRNKHFTKRDYECTNVVAIVANGPPPVTSDNRWVEADRTTLAPLTKLWVERDVAYYGYL